MPARPAQAGPRLMDAVQRSPGAPLVPRVRAAAEAALGADLSAVRVHTGQQADRAAAALHAQACTVGSHIAFRRGRFDPQSRAGRHLLLHEASHVLQQREEVTSARCDARLPVSEPGDRLEREADARAAAAMRGLAPPGPPRQSGPMAPVQGHAIQRYVGMELEHSVPIYRDIWGLIGGQRVTTELDEKHTATMYPQTPNSSLTIEVTGEKTPAKVSRKKGLEQEQSLRVGSYSYDNSAPVYIVDDVAVKTDNSQYSKALKIDLEKYNPHKLPTVIPAKGVSIPEYTTQAPGLDELAAGAKGTFEKHIAKIKEQIEINEKGQYVPGQYYVGLPPRIERGVGYGSLHLQVTVGVFPSQLDRLHRLTLLKGQVDFNPRTVQETINALMDGPLEDVIGAISAEVEKLAVADGDLWAELRKDFRAEDPELAEITAWENELQPVAAIVRQAFGDTVRSIFRVALSYYLGARLQVPMGEVEKNAVALLSRTSLTSIFTQAGLLPRMTSPHGQVQAQMLFMGRFIEQLESREDAIAKAVEKARQEGGYQIYGSHEIVANISLVELMTRLVRDPGKQGFFHVAPGTLLTKPDPLDIEKQKVQELVRPERGGSQFEYRTLSNVGWGRRFLDIGEQMFGLNTWHLDPAAQETLRKQAGW